ncbi:hypothetical protein [Cupriavidus pampae]|uniref:Uncharacterized protein n=1 Tax=Cupriavidus pampae TaxID=659251 RepID=A0ABN7YZD1_9BURK|nr:hypothetical protein [Cupriavidus pampae]CAG9179015.1 hypothetical protein LMG32289_04244 [Cupriavidus pampae]
MFDLSSAVASASAALELLKTAIKARDQSLTDRAIADMVDQLRGVSMAALTASQEALNSVREARAADQRIAELEREVRDLKSQADERNNYHLVPVGNNSFAYTLKELSPETPQRHYVCQACIDDRGKKVVLQMHDRVSLSCPGCKAVVHSDQLQAAADADYQRAMARRQTQAESDW